MTLEERTADANTQRWAIEGPSALALNRVGFSPDPFKAGDVIDVCGFALKAEHSKPTSPAVDGVESSHLLHQMPRAPGFSLRKSSHDCFWSVGLRQFCSVP
jgi:hypothetical protein